MLRQRPAPAPGRGGGRTGSYRNPNGNTAVKAGRAPVAGAALTVRLPQHLHQILRPQMRVPLQHLQRLMSRNGRNLHGVEPLLEEA